MFLNKIFILNLILFNAFVCNASDYFSSITGLENLLKTELQLATEMQNYIDNLLQHIEMLQREVNLIKHEHRNAFLDTEGYLNNPINAYRLIKRLYTDWPTFGNSIMEDKSQTNFLQNFESLKQTLSFPTQNDMIGSTMALVRLQETYRLDVAQVASGILNGVKYGTSMSWQDCFVLGQYLYSMAEYNHTISWFKQTTKMLQNDENLYKTTEILDFMEKLAEYHKLMGDVETALEILEYILRHDKNRENTKIFKMDLENLIKENRVETPLIEKDSNVTSYHDTKEFKLYERVCRNEFQNTYSPQQKHLSCKYHTNNVPFRLLQPYKLEELSLDPYIIEIYNVLSDQQIDIVKSSAKPVMERSQVFVETGESTANYRTSKTAWFQYDNIYVNDMRQHVADITGLNCDRAEDMQIVNYGLGGQYEPHFDFFTDSNWFEADYGNRIATAMFYLSDVEEGGGTAFPFLKSLVKPHKGSLLFWYNLHASGNEDYRTKHAGCPVLKGSKWIANIWIRERDQFLTKPCELVTNHKVSLMYKDYWKLMQNS